MQIPAYRCRIMAKLLGNMVMVMTNNRFTIEVDGRMEWMDSFIRFCGELGCEALVNEPMSRHSTFAIGGAADVFVSPSSEHQIAALIRYLRDNNIPYCIVGKGSNILVCDDGIRGVVLHIGKNLSGVTREGNDLICLAGTPLTELCRFALEEGLSGLEFAYGIPGSAGGAAFMNAGAYDGEMKDVLISCNHIDAEGNAGTFEGENLRLAYRGSVYSSGGYCITSLRLRLSPAPKDQIKERMQELWTRRSSKQPLDYPSAGSTFKRPCCGYAAALIEQCGLKGRSVGGAMVSTKHSGFVINTGGATCEDVLNLIRIIKDEVKQKTGVTLECEVRLLCCDN